MGKLSHISRGCANGDCTARWYIGAVPGVINSIAGDTMLANKDIASDTAGTGNACMSMHINDTDNIFTYDDVVLVEIGIFMLGTEDYNCCRL